MVSIQYMLNIVLIVIFVEAPSKENWSPLIEINSCDSLPGLYKLSVTDWLLGSQGSRLWARNYKIAVIQFTYLNHYFFSTYVSVAKLDPKNTKMN